MNDIILDETPSQPETISKYKQLLPLFVLVAYLLNAVIHAITGFAEFDGESSPYELSSGHYLALIAVVINFVVYFFYRNIYKFTLLATIGAGIVNFLVFSTFESNSIIRIGLLRIGFQPAAFWAAITVLIVNYKMITQHIFTGGPEVFDEKFQEYWTGEVRKFKQNYANYSSEDLEQIVARKKYVAQAIEAAQQLLDERKTK